MDQVPDQQDPRRVQIKSTRERLEEVRREREQQSAGYQISHAPTTIMTNMIIQVLSTIILGVGIYYIIWYLNLRREYMLPRHYTLFVGTMLLVAAGWVVYTIIRLRTDFRRYRAAIERRTDRERTRRSGLR